MFLKVNILETNEPNSVERAAIPNDCKTQKFVPPLWTIPKRTKKKENWKKIKYYLQMHI